MTNEKMTIHQVERRCNRSGRQGDRSVAQRHIQGAAFQRSYDHGLYFGQASDELYQDHRRRQRKAGNEPVRSDQGTDHLAQQVVRRR